jgi:hypothetical protein
VPSKLESAVVTVEAWVTGTANNAIATRNNQAIFFFMKFSSSGLVLSLLGLLDLWQSNREDFRSERGDEFAQDTKHGGFTWMFR